MQATRATVRRRRQGARGVLARLASGALACGLAYAGAFGASAAVAQPLAQPGPTGGSLSLNAALARLARDPRDLTALIDAGNAALQMGDVDAALGFFARADQLSPNNMRVKAGLAGAMVRSDNPFDAIPIFAEAERAGVSDPLLAADRGLAYDLVGDNATAQRYYRQSLAVAPGEEVTRRLALSQAIAGDRAGMEQTLSPLLQRQDKSAWRTRAFALAILGRPEEAIAIANQSMPADLANGIAPYLRYMPRLTPAQQAAAANFGRFPRAAEIGRDDPRVALYAPPRRVATADSGLVPSGEPLGRARSRKDGKPRPATPAEAPALAAAVPPLARSAPPEPMPVRQVTAAPALATAAPSPQPEPARPAASGPAPAAAEPAATRPAPTLASASGFNLARVGATATPSSGAAPAPLPAAAAPPPAATPAPKPAPFPAPAAAPAPAPARASSPARAPRRVADAFADFTLPTGPAAPAPGAVDIRKIAPAKPKPVEPAKPAHPSRIWVQVGTGRDVKALGFTWRGLAKDNPELFRGKEPSVSDWGRTNRLLTGPFTTEAGAEAFLARLRKNEVDAFIWTSPAGQVVDDLPGR